MGTFVRFIVLAAVWLGPITIYLRHSYAVKRVTKAADDRLAGLPGCEPGKAEPRRIVRFIDLAFKLLAGPALIISLIGEIGGPDVFRGTPLWGADIGPFDVAAMILLAIRVVWSRFLVTPRLAGRR